MHGAGPGALAAGNNSVSADTPSSMASPRFKYLIDMFIIRFGVPFLFNLQIRNWGLHGGSLTTPTARHVVRWPAARSSDRRSLVVQLLS